MTQVNQPLNHATLHLCCYFTDRNHRYLILKFSIMRSLCFFRFLGQLGNLLLQVALFALELRRLLALSLGLRLALGQLLGAALQLPAQRFNVGQVTRQRKRFVAQPTDLTVLQGADTTRVCKHAPNTCEFGYT